MEEWLLVLCISLLLLLLLCVLLRYGDTEGIYRQRIVHTLTDRRRMVSVSPVKLPYTVQLQRREDGGGIVVTGVKKCVLTCYVCVNVKGQLINVEVLYIYLSWCTLIMVPHGQADVPFASV